MKPKVAEKTIMILFTLIGLVFIGAGAYIIYEDAEFKESSKETTATITGIDSRGSGDDTEYIVYVEFEVDGTTVSGTFGSYNSLMKTGDSVSVYYNPENPSDFRSGSISIVGIIFIGIGGVFFVVGGIFVIISLKNGSKKKRLLEIGTRVDAEIIEARYNMSYSVNHQNPVNVYCKTGIYSNELLEFKSENLWYDVESIIMNNNITKLPVYIDPDNPKVHYVDMSILDSFVNK